jgi:hypothetical protein
VAHMKRTADRLFGDEYVWSVLGAGRSQMPIASMGAAMGGNVPVGLEDSLWDGSKRYNHQPQSGSCTHDLEPRRPLVSRSGWATVA